MQSAERFLDTLKNGKPLTKNVLKQLAKRFLIPLGLTVAGSVAEAGIIKKNLRIEHTSFGLSTGNSIDDIMEKVKSFEESGLLIKGVSATIKN